MLRIATVTPRLAIATTTACALLLTGCGGGGHVDRAQNEIEHSLARLQRAIHGRDVHTTCELVVPVPPGGSVRQLTTAGRRGLQAEIRDCDRSFARRGDNFAVFERALQGLTVSSVARRDGLVLARVKASRPGSLTRLPFARLEGKWRLLFGAH